MTIHRRLFVIPALALGLQSVFAGDITGTITLNGTPPENKINEAIATNPDCSKLHPEPVKVEFYVVGANKGLKDVVVTLEDVTGKSTGESSEPIVLDQKGCEYTPYITAVQTKQKIIIRNSDPVLHNVDVVPTVSGNKPQNSVQTPGGSDITVSFSEPESFLKFKCDIHPWMFSYVTVVDSPYFSVSDKDGSFKIANVPPGKYTIEAIHRKAGKVTQEVEVKDGNVSVNLSLDVPK